MAFGPFGDASLRGYLRNVAGETDRDKVKFLEYLSFTQRVQSWLASSRHRFGLYKWSLCRLMG